METGLIIQGDSLEEVKKLADQRVKNLQSLASGVSTPKKTLPRRKTLKRK